MRIYREDAKFITRSMLDGKTPVVYVFFQDYNDPDGCFVEQLVVESVTLQMAQGKLIGCVTACAASSAEYTFKITDGLSSNRWVFTDETEVDAFIEACENDGIDVEKRF